MRKDMGLVILHNIPSMRREIEGGNLKPLAV